MNSSIFGSSAPKFVFDLGGGNEETVNLDYWVPLREDSDVRNIVQESELEADRFIIPRGNYLEVEGKIYLYKYADIAARESKFAQIYQYRNQNVALWKHRDGQAYRDASNNVILFYLESVIPKNITTLDYRDVLYLKFISLKEVSYPNSYVIIPTLEEIIMSNDY